MNEGHVRCGQPEAAKGYDIGESTEVYPQRVMEEIRRPGRIWGWRSPVYTKSAVDGAFHIENLQSHFDDVHWRPCNVFFHFDNVENHFDNVVERPCSVFFRFDVVENHFDNVVERPCNAFFRFDNVENHFDNVVERLEGRQNRFEGRQNGALSKPIAYLQVIGSQIDLG